MKREEKIKVEITKTNCWYVKGEIHEVFNYITFEFGINGDNDPCFEKGEHGTYGISVYDCKILPLIKEIEYTYDELKNIIGHDFKIIDI